jgi:hypothetical protein
VFTNWIMHPGKIPQLSTARPTKDEERLAGAAQSHTYAVPSSLQGEEKWAAIYRLAHESGLSAAELCVPTPMKVVGFSVVMDGLCGFAWVQIPDARRGFARWVVRSGHGRPGYRGGARISAARLSQSIDRAVAYAKAFASVLQLNGIPCKVESRLD